MKNQYFGDINDYRKYGLLRCFEEAKLKVGVCWMLTQDVANSDGQETRYLQEPWRWRQYDPELFDFLDKCVADGKRSVRRLEESQNSDNGSGHRL